MISDTSLLEITRLVNEKKCRICGASAPDFQPLMCTCGDQRNCPLCSKGLPANLPLCPNCI